MAFWFIYSVLTLLVGSSFEFITFTKQPHDIIIREGSRLDIDCVASSTIPDAFVVVTWKHNATWITDFDGKHFILMRNGTLHFRSFSVSDQGTYQCFALLLKERKVVGRNFSRVGLVQTAYIGDTFISFPSGIKEKIGNKVDLQCVSPKSLPIPILFWEKDGHKLSGYHNASIVLNKNTISSTLEIIMFSYKDIGKYRCCISNPLIREKVICCPYFVVQIKIIQFDPYFIVKPKSMISVRYSSSVMDCFILGDPLPKVTWKKNGIRISSITHEILANKSLLFTSVDLPDGAQYTCSGVNKIGSITSPIATLKVAFIDFDFILNPRDQIVLSGNTFLLHCQPPQSFPEKVFISWYKSFHNVVPSGRISILQNGTLRVSSSEISDGADYFCEAFNNIVGVPRSSKKATITIHILPSLDILNNSMSAIEGHPLKIKCNSSGIPFPNTTLFKRSSNNDLKVLSYNGNYFVPNVDVSDGGDYLCIAQNIEGKAKKNITVNILFPPKISLSPFNVTLLMGKLLFLKCNFSGNPFPLVHWEFINFDNISSIVKNTSKVNVLPDKLVIFRTRKGNEGWYKCIGKNSVGIFKLHAFVKVLIPPTIQNITGNLTTTSTDSAILSCTCFSDPSSFIYWVYNGQNISQTQKYGLQTLEKRENNLFFVTVILSISHLSLTDAGEYVCACYNTLARRTMPTNIKVHVAPKITLFTLKSRMYFGDAIHIVCCSFSIPPPSIQLSHNGSLIYLQKYERSSNKTILSHVISNITSNNSGIYICTANNSLGYDQMNRSIVVKLFPIAPQLNQPFVLSSSSILITWTLMFDGYSHVQDISLESSSLRGNMTYIISPFERKYIFFNLLSFTTYIFQMRAKNEVGFSKFSEVVHARTMQGHPSIPLNVTCYNKMSTSVQLAWYQPLHANGIIKIFQFFVYGKTNFSVNHTIQDERKKYIRTLNELDPYTNYNVIIRAATITSSFLNWGNFSEQVHFVTRDGIPGVVDILGVNLISFASVNITWTEPSKRNGIITAYNVLIKNIQMKLLSNYNSTVEYLIVTNLTPHSKYVAFVIAKTSAGQGNVSTGFTFETGGILLTTEFVLTTIETTTPNITPSVTPRNSSTPAGTLILDQDSIHDAYFIVIIGVSVFAVILLFAIFTTIFARCLCGGKKKNDVPNAYVGVGNHLNIASSSPTRMLSDFQEDFIFEDVDSFDNVIENDRSFSPDGYNCVEPYQGQRVANSPLVKLKGLPNKCIKKSLVNKNISTNPIYARNSINHSYMPDYDTNQSGTNPNDDNPDDSLDSSADVSVVDLINAFLENEKWYMEEGTHNTSTDTNKGAQNVLESTQNRYNRHEAML